MVDPVSVPERLLVLVGITAARSSRTSVARFFELHSPYRTFVPGLPFYRGVRSSARWLGRYLDRTVYAQGCGPVHVLAYIGGAFVLRCLAASRHLPYLARIVHVRGPVQERVPAAMVARYGRLLARLLAGRGLIDLAQGWPQALPLVGSSSEQGLIIEGGVSARARALGLGLDSVAAEDWEPARLLPAGSAVLRVPESHDEVYTSPRLLAAALAFFQHGYFTPLQPAGAALPSAPGFPSA